MFEWKVGNGNMSSASCKGGESITKCGLVLGVSMTKWNMFWSLMGHATRTASTRCRGLRAGRDYHLI